MRFYYRQMKGKTNIYRLEIPGRFFCGQWIDGAINKSIITATVLHMYLFVDANIFLDFYHFSNDDLDELKKLVDVITNKEITLVVTSQILDEVKRNRDGKIADAYKKFKDSKIELNLPQICKGYPEFIQIKTLLHSLKRLITELDEKLIQDIKARTLKADEIINQLFRISKIIDTEQYLEPAKNRYHLGNPPGKNNSYGDGLNWIALLSDIPEGEDLFFLSDDKDYKSPLDEFTLNSYLLDEWKKYKKSEVFFYTRLSDFFNEHRQDIQLKVEEGKNELISKLSNSANFASTHAIVAKLRKYVSFTDEQIRELVVIAENNSQVFSILSDNDILSFYEKLLENKENLFNEETLNKIKVQMHFQEENADLEETIPF
jgi:predicted nucleic acid-binding protein